MMSWMAFVCQDLQQRCPKSSMLLNCMLQLCFEVITGITISENVLQERVAGQTRQVPDIRT